MATDTNNFKKFLEKSYDSTFNTRRSGKNNVITRVNSCVVDNLNEVIEPKIKNFELLMSQECYTTLGETPTLFDIQNCVSKYGKLDDKVFENIQQCLTR